jgi:hypothetical protein
MHEAPLTMCEGPTKAAAAYCADPCATNDTEPCKDYES